MKKFLFCLLLASGFMAEAQVYNNEWIDYSKTYYKFKVGKTGLYQVSQPALSTAGLGNSPAEYFQLWRNGVQIPIYTSVVSGPLSSTDYIEFWGQMNDGKPDKELYRSPEYQLNGKWSLETDTATYFLTINPNITQNLRLQNANNNVAGNSLPAEPYFMYTVGKYFKDQINPGYAVNVGEYLYSSSYDKGEGWTGVNIGSFGTSTFTFNNLYVYNSGPAPSFNIGVAGNALNPRRYLVTINADSVIGNEVDFFNYTADSTSFSLSTLAGNSASVAVTSITQCNTPPNCNVADRMVIAKYEITYPRQFNFGGASNFEFALPASGTGNFLQISNFSYGSATPVLYDLSNGQRYIADMSAAPLLQFALPPSQGDRNFVLVSEDVSNVNSIVTFQSRNFIDYSKSSNQGDYLIITNPVLFNGANGTNPVDEYRLYRSSAAGGGYNVHIYTEDELTDQFGFGIKKSAAALRDFARFARKYFAVYPKYVFIIGKGVNYTSQRALDGQPDLDKLNLVTTFGYPASDILLTAEPGSSIPEIPIGRLSVINAHEVSVYLKKIKEYEGAQAALSPSIESRGWMKNIVHIIGSSDPSLGTILSQFMDSYRQIITDTSFGGTVTTFSKLTSNTVEQLSDAQLQTLFSDGISLITYFGHSSSTTLDFNLDNPANYNNFGKYPMFIGLGCNAGNFFNYNLTRLQVNETLSEKYVLEPDRGTIGFIASTHFGIVHYLDIWNSRAYNEITNTSYGKSIGEIMKKTSKDVFDFTTEEDFYARCNVEETELHGDPAITLNPQPKADYVIEDPMVKVTPGFVSVADHFFKLDVKMMNIGKVVNKNIVVEIKRQYPDNSVAVIFRDTIPGIRYIDSISINVPVDPNHDKGLNRITVTVDADNAVDEIYETNNSITKNVEIYEDEVRPIYPANYAIVNKQNIKLLASTANPLTQGKQYTMELDTTQAFNSPLKISKSVTSVGGIIEFDAGTAFADSTVYYWRVAPVVTSGNQIWNTASFIYLGNSDVGFNQSHFFQQLNSTSQRMWLDTINRTWEYKDRINNIFLRNGVYPYTSDQGSFYTGTINDNPGFIGPGCTYNELIFNVIDPVAFHAWQNDYSGPSGKYNSYRAVCGPGRLYNFEYLISDINWRKKAMDFIDSIPDGYYVTIRGNVNPNTAGNTYPSVWKTDQATFGAGNTLYDKLFNQGFVNLDSFNRPRSWIFIFKKNKPNEFAPKSIVSQGIYDAVTVDANPISRDTLGFITSPVFGPAKAWKQLKWRGNSLDAQSGDLALLNVIGITKDGTESVLFNSLSSDQDVDISSVDAAAFPFIKLQMQNQDSIYNTPYQLNYWRLTYVPSPEGAVAPNIIFQFKDTVDVAQPINFKMAFRNISDAGFDSMKVKMMITDRNNVQHILPVSRYKPLAAQDTVNFSYQIDTRQLVGANTFYIEANPDNDQPELYHFNNFVFKNFYVKGDTLNPLMDVTFDNIHILNHDIVSSKPVINIKLKDEAKYFLLDDNSVMHVQVQYPDGSLHPYAFDNDTLQFIPAQSAPSNNNTASAIFKPLFTQDGEYQLIVSGKDMSNNKAGTMEYRIAFNVINKAMISNMLNYPNPFTTSTAFVFTLTGSEVPQNIKIEIMTITGKIVRVITKDELGPLHIGRNITEFKWDGKDEFGQELANGVYLYRVVTNLNGKSLDKYTSNDDNNKDQTDKYFKRGVGKMYKLR